MSRTMRMLALGLALTVGLTISGVTGATADPGDPTTAYGEVADFDTGDALTGLVVEVYDVDPTTPDAESVTTADTPPVDVELGDYSVVLAPGHYWFVASADGHKQLTFEADILDTSGGSQNLGVAYLEAQTGTLAGTVNADDGGYDCADVEFYRVGTDPDNGPYSSTSTGELDDEGAYTRDLPIGDYKVRVSDDGCEDYVSVWVGGTSFADATEFTVYSDQTTTVTTVLLDNGAKVSGIVQDGLSNAPLDSISVALKSADGLDSLDFDTTDASGQYSFSGLTPGDYQLQFSDELGEYEPATRAVTVTSVDQIRPVVGLAMTPVGTDTNLLKGKVTGPTNIGIGNINVYVTSTDTGDEYNARTKRDGNYSVNVPAGSYKVEFSEYDNEEEQLYRSEWFDNAPTYEKAKTVVVNTATVTVNAALVKNAIISGKISGPAGFQVDGYVVAYDADGEQVDGDDVDESGNYRIEGLAPGTYRIKAVGYAYGDDFGFPLIRQYYAGKYTLSSATVISAANGAVVTGRNITLSNKLSAYSAPKVSGTAKKGKKLTASVGAWTIAVDTEYKYQWYRGTSKISGQTARTHTVTSSDVGKKLKVVVTGSNRYDHYAPGTSSSASTKTVVK